MSTQPKKEIWEGLRRIVGSRWTQNKNLEGSRSRFESWEGSRMSPQPKNKNWEGSRRVVGLRWTQNNCWEG